MSSNIEMKINALVEIFKQIDKNYSDMERWRNIPLVRDSFQRLKDLPLRYKDEINPYIRIDVIEKMLDCIYAFDTPRLALSIREYQLEQFSLIISDDTKDQEETVSAEEVGNKIEQLRDYINPNFPIDEYLKKYKRTLNFDPIERSETWENIIYEVEEEIYKQTGKGGYMGFCHHYWSVKRNVLEQYGIKWDSPPITNPGTLFD